MTDWALELAETRTRTFRCGRVTSESSPTATCSGLGGGDQPGSNVAQRFRFSVGELDAVRAEIHEHVRDRGRTVCSWEVGSSATPADLVERLLELGPEADDEPLRVGMALTTTPPEVPGVEVRRAETDDDPPARGSDRSRGVRDAVCRARDARLRYRRLPRLR
jgi:hypothetical protein